MFSWWWLLVPLGSESLVTPQTEDVLLYLTANDTNFTTAGPTTPGVQSAGGEETTTTTDAAFDPGAWEILCRWTAWDEWSSCTCHIPNVHRQYRQRRVQEQIPSALAQACRVLTLESRPCNSTCPAPPVDCTWGPWDSWSACSSSCGDGGKTRSRHVYRRATSTGNPCVGPGQQSLQCSAGSCAHVVIMAWGGIMVGICVLFGLYILWFRGRLKARRVVPTLQDEEDEAASLGEHGDGAWLEGIPDYWTNKHNSEAGDFHEMVHVSAAQHEKFNQLLRAAYLPKCTQDRPCPNGTCPKTPLGCPCVQPGGTPGLPVGYCVRRVIRVESAGMWRRYARRREEICSWRSGEDFWKFEPPLRSTGMVDSLPDMFEPLDTFANEAYAFHGTSVRSALSIGREDYRIDLAGSGAGTMYGLGTYLAESCTKADEYARDMASGPYQGVFAMLLSRVCMGKFYYTTQRDMKARQLVLGGEFDSTLGDREESAGTFRELVVYDTDQVYPEYILLYHRVHAGDASCAAALASRPLAMELPVYWRNCHRDLSGEDFMDQYRVRRATLGLLQLLVLRSLTGPLWNVVRARRVENSTVWRRYCGFKDRLRQRLAEDAGEEDEEEGSGSPAARRRDLQSSGGVMTFNHLRDPAFSEQAVSIDHLDAEVNEHLLWHGTSRSNAESIAAQGFSVPLMCEVEHGKRFGRGVYFAEELGKSLEYSSGKDEHCFVLLCRVACGRFHCTDGAKEPEANLRALEAGKDSVLASPGGYGPREFVALEDDQMYPEYVLELAPDTPPPPPPPPPADAHFEQPRPMDFSEAELGGPRSPAPSVEID